MKITDVSIQARNPDRVNIFVDGKYRFSLDVFQVTELGVKTGQEYSEEELSGLKDESEFGKLYARALEYTMLRPHSAKEIRDYLWRKTLSRKYKSRNGELQEHAGVSQDIVDRVFNRLCEKNYINDEVFASWWVENRNQTKGTSRRKLIAELRTKGVESSVAEAVFEHSGRSDAEELQKIIAKKRGRYDDEQKFVQYLARQGFGYDLINAALKDYQNPS